MTIINLVWKYNMAVIKMAVKKQLQNFVLQQFIKICKCIKCIFSHILNPAEWLIAN